MQPFDYQIRLHQYPVVHDYVDDEKTWRKIRMRDFFNSVNTYTSFLDVVSKMRVLLGLFIYVSIERLLIRRIPT